MRLAALKQFVPHRLRRAAAGWLNAPPADWAALWLRAAPKWHIDRFVCDPEAVWVDAWVVCPTAERGSLDVRWNGSPFQHTLWFPRPDVAAQLPFLRDHPEWGAFGFVGRHRPDPPLSPREWVRVELAGRASGRPREDLGPPESCQVADPADVWPDATRRQRVHGLDDLETFRRAGGTVFARLREGLRRTTGLDFADLPRVLDWGCGCGRVSRYLLQLPGVRLTGVDVDPDNVGWCEANLPGGVFWPVPLHPPMPLPEAGFDLAVGVSVFTHLKEPEQVEWLAELRRVVRPGGVLLMTTHGEAAVALSRLSGRAYRRLLRRGIADIPNRQYDAELAEADYYRNTFHTEAYVRREWGRHFEVLAVLPGFLGVQDLVVLKRV